MFINGKAVNAKSAEGSGTRNMNGKAADVKYAERSIMCMRLCTKNTFLEMDANGILLRNATDLTAVPGVIHIIKDGKQEQSEHSNVNTAEKL